MKLFKKLRDMIDDANKPSTDWFDFASHRHCEMCGEVLLSQKYLDDGMMYEKWVCWKHQKLTNKEVIRNEDNI